MSDDHLPDYEPMLAAYHSAFAAELEAMVATLPIREGDLVLEVACGDGAYMPWLAKRVCPSGKVVCLDLMSDYLEVARQHAAEADGDDCSDFTAGSIERMPFAAGTFDLAWCAQSLFSLPDSGQAVGEMARVVKPGGVVAVLEDDTLHHVMLPWPVEVEMAVQSAQWRAFVEETADPRKFYVGRQLIGIFRKAGLVDVQVRSFASVRFAPLDDPARRYLIEYLKDLRGWVGPRLEPDMRARFDALADPESPDGLANRPDLAMTVLDHVVQGRVPGP